MFSLDSESHATLFERALPLSDPEFEEIHDFMKHTVMKTPNPRNPRQFLKRKQCTFVLPHISSYEFGQFNQTFRSEESEWPSSVRMALDHVRKVAPSFGVDPALYTGVHVNLYADGSVGVKPHFDKEGSMVAGMPIFSFTALSDASRPRDFSFYTLDGEKIRDVTLQHGDLLVMWGKMQSNFKHGVEAAKPPRQYRDLARINFTVRAFVREE